MIRLETLGCLTDPELVACRHMQMARLAAIYRGDKAPKPYVLAGYTGKSPVSPYKEPEHWVESVLDDLAENSVKLRDPLVFRPLIVEFDTYGVHFIDSMFGAHVYTVDSGMGEEFGWQAEYLDQPVGYLEMPDLDNAPTWALARQVAEAFVATGVTVPLFGLPIIASPLNIAVNLYGQEILLAMVSEPSAAHHDLKVITELLCRLHRWYRNLLPSEQLQPTVAGGRTQPPGFGQLCGCTTQLVSAEQYEVFIAPLDDRLLSVYPHGGMIHLCGAHTQHIPVWRDMKSLRAVQMNDRAIDDLGDFYDGLRHDQMLYCNPYEQMPVEQVLAITGGDRTILVGEYPEAIS